MEIKPSRNFSFYIATRYFRTKRKIAAINIISGISMTGVAVGTMALVVVLSVFNGFDYLIKGMFNAYDPDIKITAARGKVFIPDSVQIVALEKLEAIDYMAFTLEENAMFQFRDKQFIGVVKGVNEHYSNVTQISKTIIDGNYLVTNENINRGVMGQGLAYYLGYMIGIPEPITIWIPNRSAVISMNPAEAFNKQNIYPSGVFAIENDFDSKYMLVPMDMVREMLNYPDEVSSIDIKLKEKTNQDETQAEILKILGTGFEVKNRYQQQELLYKIMKTEKWAIFFILIFIILVASLNIISSMMMVILDKKDDIKTIHFLGANWQQIRKVFLFQGLMVSIIGAMIGLVTGLIICWLQMTFGLITLGGATSFIIDSYPVLVKTWDVLFIFLTVSLIGLAASWLPVRVISPRILES